MQGKPVAEQEIGKQLLLETAAYAETSVCRRKVLLHYFGEEYLEENCGNCDNCLNPKKQVEAKELLSAVLEVISTLKEKFKADYIVNMLSVTRPPKFNLTNTMNWKSSVRERTKTTRPGTQ